MSFRVEFSRDAAAYLQRLDRRSQERVARRIEQIAQEPRGRHSKPLAGPGSHHATRVGGWRIVFTIDDRDQVVSISDIGPRGQVYRDLRETPP